MKAISKKSAYIKYACYAGSASQAAVICLSPILFVTFHDKYGISYTLLGMLAVFNFVSQLIIDLIFSFLSHKFNVEKTVKYTPLLTVTGIILYAILPMIFPQYTYFGIVIGTVIFSVASGLCEVLLSPTIVALSEDECEREMSKFHSVYAWGVVSVVVISSIFLKLFGTDNWYYLALLWTVLPLTSFILFSKGKMPEMKTGLSSEKEQNNKKMLKQMILFILCIFFGSASENNMTQWCSSYLEKVFGFDKFLCDIIGLACFSVMLGIVRTLYGKYGRNIYKVMVLSFIGATACYLIAGLTDIKILGLIACIVCGLCVSMLWPGTIIWTENSFSNCSIVVYALLAAGGDFGASVAPQLTGMITDIVSKSSYALNVSLKTGISVESIGLKSSMVISTLFSAAGILIVLLIHYKFDKKNQKN